MSEEKVREMRVKVARHERDVFRLYGLYRSYIVHEDTLISQRMQRMLFVQGALLTAGSTLLIRLAELPGQPTNAIKWAQRTYTLLLVLIAAFGFVTARLSQNALRAAADAIEKLDTDWKDVNGGWERLGQATWKGLHLPGIVGGGLPSAHKRGLAHVASLPRMLQVTWLLLFVVCLIILLEKFPFSVW